MQRWWQPLKSVCSDVAGLFWLWASLGRYDYFKLILLQLIQYWDVMVAKRKSRDHWSQQDLSSGDHDATTIPFLITFCRFQCFVLHSLVCVYAPHLQPSSSKVWWRLLLPVKYLHCYQIFFSNFPFFQLSSPSYQLQLTSVCVCVCNITVNLKSSRFPLQWQILTVGQKL